MSSMAPEGLMLDRDHPYFWATVYSIQNIGECATQIDRINQKILESLADIPEWKQIKGMRTILSHNFWQIETRQIKEVIEEGLPALRSFLGCFRVFDEVCNDDFSATYDGSSRMLLAGRENAVFMDPESLLVGERDYFKPGNCAVGMFINARGDINVSRFHPVGDYASNDPELSAGNNASAVPESDGQGNVEIGMGIVMSFGDQPVLIRAVSVQGPLQ